MSLNNRRVVHSSPLRGVTERETGRPHLYKGGVFRIPAKSSNDDVVRLITETEITDKIEEFIAGDEELEFPQDGVIERHEAYDLDTGDLLVMFRVPFRQKRQRQGQGA